MAKSSKGGAWEREVAKMLSKWLTGKEKPYVWWRTPSSGAMATISNENKELSGDLIDMRPEGAFLTDKFSIECKNGYASANFHKHFKDNKNDEIRAFWEQACRDADIADKLPMLIFKKNNNPPIIGIPMINTKLEELPSITVRFAKKHELPTAHFFQLKEFLELMTPEDVQWM